MTLARSPSLFVLALALRLLGSLAPASAQSSTNDDQCIANALAGGTGDVITIPLIPCSTNTNLLLLTAAAANSSSSPTLQQLPGGPALPIVRPNGVALLPGDISGPGYVALLSSTGASWVLLNPANRGSVQITGLGGLADAGPAINTAMANASAEGMLDAYLPSGFIRVQTSIKAVAGVHLHGQGCGTYGQWGTYLQWTGAAHGILYDASVTTGAMTNPGLSDVCLDGGGLADIVFNLRGVSWGVYHDLNITGGVQYGIYEDVATVSPLHSDQQTQMTHVQINCSSGECWRIGPGAWPVIGGVVTGVDVTENYFRDFTLNTTGSATAGLHGIGGDGNHFENFFGASANGAYDVIADCGTGTGSYSDAFRENVWTGVNIFAHGFHAVKCGSRFSYGNVIFGLKKEDSGAMVVDDGAGLTWYDTLGAINTAGSGTFGNKFPLFTAGGSASAAGVGFNQVLNSSGQWVFGLGSTFNWAALMYFDPSSGMLHYQPSSTFGAAGGVVTNADKFTVDQYGNARVYNNLTVDGFASAVWGYQLSKGAPLAAAPGAGLLRFQAVAGTNAGTCKIIAYAGTSATPTTIIDNVGGGC